MAICYGCVAIGNIGIIAEYSGDCHWNFKAAVSSMLPKIATENTKKILMHQRYNFAVLPDNGLLYICATTLDESKEAIINKNKHLCAVLVVEEGPGEYESASIHNEDIKSAPNLTVVPLDAKKALKLSVCVKKKMKQYKRGKRKLKKSKKIRIPGFGKRKHSADPSDQPAFLTPSSNDKYVALKQEDKQLCASEAKGYSSQDVINDVQTPPRISKHTIENLQTQVQEVHGIVRDGIERVLKRGEKLDDLLERADELEAKAREFQKTTKRLKRKMKWRNRRITITAVGAAGVVLTAVVVLAVVLTV